MTQAGIFQGRDWLGLTGIVSDWLGLAWIRSDWVGFARNDLDSLLLQINYCAVVLVDHEFFWLARSLPRTRRSADWVSVV